MVRLNAIVTIALMLVSGFVGYKIGDFSLSGIFEEKLREEIAKTNEAIEIAQEAHKEEIAKISIEYNQKMLAADKKYKEEEDRLRDVITNKDEDIQKLEKEIDKKSEEILATQSDVAVLTSEKEVLELKVKQQVALTHEEKERLKTLNSKLKQKDQQIAQLEKDVLTAKEEKEGRVCLDKFVPTSLDDRS